MLPSAAELNRGQIEAGLDGDQRAALKARVILRRLCGPIVICVRERRERVGSFRPATRGAAQAPKRLRKRRPLREEDSLCWCAEARRCAARTLQKHSLRC